MKQLQEIMQVEEKAAAMIVAAEKEAEKILLKAKKDVLDYVAAEKKKVDAVLDTKVRQKSAHFEQEQAQILDKAKMSAAQLHAAASKHKAEAIRLLRRQVMEG